VSVDYRLAPEHPYPAALQDVTAAYRALVEQASGADRVVVSGESAGGNLAIELLIAGKAEDLPVPARQLWSRQMLGRYLAALQAVSVSVLVVAGDPAQPQGPYVNAASVIGLGLLEEHGVRQASVAGHPGGHPAVADGELWAALAAKTAALGRRALGGDVITQFGCDAAQVLAWLTEVRARGIGLPVRVSVPGPATVRRLLSIASRCGVAVSASVAEEYGFSLTEPTRTAGPGRFIQTLASGYDPRSHGDVKLHFNAFGGFSATVQWIESI
jgi:methylenetetrahydrofolate reductase (NADPH)